MAFVLANRFVSISSFLVLAIHSAIEITAEPFVLRVRIYKQLCHLYPSNPDVHGHRCVLTSGQHPCIKHSSGIVILPPRSRAAYRVRSPGMYLGAMS